MCKLVNEIREQFVNGNYNIEDSTNRILQEYNISKTKTVPIVNILKNMGISVYQDSMEMSPDTIAYFVVNPELYSEFENNKIACVNSNITYGFKRFALAHELAHYIFDYSEDTQSTFYSTYKSTDDEEDDGTGIEVRANQFAENLLLPKDEFKTLYFKYLKETKSLPDTLVKLADNYSVDVSCINKRIKHLKQKGCFR